jgi:hypothetical protein
MTVPSTTPDPNRSALTRRVARGLLRLGTVAAKGVGAALATVLALVGATQSGSAVIGFLVLIMAAAGVIGWECETRRRPAPLSAAQRSEVANGVVLAAVAVLAVAGADELAGMTVAALVATLAAVAAVVRARRGLAGPLVSAPKQTPARSVPSVAAPEVLREDSGARFVPPETWHIERRAMADLVQAWRHSFLLLATARTDPIRLAQICEQRRAYLDELARRDPAGFRRWMNSGARAAGDPSRYLTFDPRSEGGHDRSEAA